MRQGLNVTFGRNGVQVSLSTPEFDLEDVVATGSLRDGLFYLDTPNEPIRNSVCLMDAKVDKGEAQLLHERWGHCSWKRMSQLLKRFGNERIDPEDKCFCAPCVQAKSHARKTNMP